MGGIEWFTQNILSYCTWPDRKKGLQNIRYILWYPRGKPERGELLAELYVFGTPSRYWYYGDEDKTGLYNRFSADVSYAYHLGLSPRTNLAAGFSAGFTRVGYDFSKATPADLNDPIFAYNNSEINKIRPDLNVGIWLYSADYFIGASTQQVIPQKIRFVDDASYGSKLIPHVFVTAGYRFLLNEDMNAIPSVMIKYNTQLAKDPQVEGNVKVQYRDLLWLGGSYRYKYGYAVMVGLNVANTFNVGYSYDFTRTSLNEVSHGTHELVIGFLLGNRYADTCPRNVW
jgi:type IX secretion system PorP/SprF family membrane protein